MNLKETDHPYVSISFDEEKFIILYSKDEESRSYEYNWNNITKVCFKTYDYGAPHFAYLYFTNEVNPLIVPIESKGREKFWEEIKNRKLFDPRLEKYSDRSSPEFNCYTLEDRD